MSKKIIGITVGTPMNPQAMVEKTEQAKQIKKNTTDISKLSEEIADLKENGIDTVVAEVVGKYYEGTDVTAETDVEQKVIDAYQDMMSECMGDYDKIPFLLQTDNHRYFPKNIYELCGKMLNYPQISKVITLGDLTTNYYNEKHLQEFVDAMKPFPVEKRISVAGNHDVWAGATERVYIDQSKLSTYLKNYTLKRKSTNGYGVVTDDYFNVKYLIISNYDKEEGEGGSRISTKQVNFIIEELSKNDGYDIVILSHEPISISNSTATHLLAEGSNLTTGNYFNYISSRNGFIQMLLGRKTKGNGTYTDDEGVEHTYDFTNCTSDLLCCFCGHMHVEAFDFIGGELLIVSFGSICKADGNPIYFGYVDRKNRLVKYYRASGDYSSAVTVGLDKTSATNMILDKTEITMDIGSLEVISPIFTPLTTGNQRITWTSDNELVATVTKGFVTAVSSGMATITAVSEDGSFTATCLVTVGEGATLTSISATYTGGTVAVGTNLSELTGIVVTANYDDGTTATVTNYTLSGEILEGENTITVTFGEATTTIIVTGVAEEEAVTLTSISVNYSGGNVPVGTDLTELTGITVTASYSDGSTSEVTGYTLSGEIVEGENTITVMYGGFTKTFTVTGTDEKTVKATETLELVYATGEPNFTTFAYTESATPVRYVVAKQSTIPASVLSVDYDTSVYEGFNLDIFLFDADGTPYLLTDKAYLHPNTNSSATYKFEGDMGDIIWETPEVADSWGNCEAPFTVNIPDNCTVMVAMRYNASLAGGGTGATTNTGFAEWAKNNVNITVTQYA